MTAPPFPGAVGLSHLKVYTSAAPDGLKGGSAHMHLVCSEAYVVLAGRGTVQTLGPEGYREEGLEPGKVVWFTPGLIHRLVNRDGALEILALMQNAGLPEAGDFVFTFPPEVMADETRYLAAASLQDGAHAYASGEEAARRRRDLAVEGFLALRRRVEEEGAQALEGFYRRVAELAAPRLERWQELFAAGPLEDVHTTQGQLRGLQEGRLEHLLAASVYALPMSDERKLGMCGTLAAYTPSASSSGSHLPEGLKL